MRKRDHIPFGFYENLICQRKEVRLVSLFLSIDTVAAYLGSSEKTLVKVTVKEFEG